MISFHVKENKATIGREVIDDLVREYMRLRRETGVILAVAHRDTDHVHVHFCTSALHYRTGKSFGLSKVQLYELKTKFQEYHRKKYPELTKSLPEHGKAQRYRTHAQWHAHRRQEITEKVREIFKASASRQAFLESLRDAGLHHYERGGRPTGIEYKGAKFRFSRLLDGGQLDDLTVDQTEKSKALAEIQARRGAAGTNTTGNGSLMRDVSKKFCFC